jgi:hypothetical protein
MKLEFHPAVQEDFVQARDYYQTEGGPHLADRFEREFQACLAVIQVASSRFPFYLGSNVFRRIRLRNFPYLNAYDAARIKDDLLLGRSGYQGSRQPRIKHARNGSPRVTKRSSVATETPRFRATSRGGIPADLVF